MKKLLIVLVVIAVVWLAKLSFDVFQMNAQNTELLQQQTQLQQQTAGLNDQLVAMKRQLGTQATTSIGSSSAPQPATDELTISIQPVVVIGQQLDLIEFALQQQEFGVALDKLNQLDQQLAQLSLAPALRMSLHQVIQKDRESLKQYVTARQAQLDKVKNSLQALDKMLEKEIQQPYVNQTKNKDQTFWQRWIQIESVQTPSPALMQRGLVLKEIQLRLILAQQILNQGQYPQFQQELTEIIQIMQQLPDPSIKQMQKRVLQLKDTPVISIPHLNTRALIG